MSSPTPLSGAVSFFNSKNPLSVFIKSDLKSKRGKRGLEADTANCNQTDPDSKKFRDATVSTVVSATHYRLGSCDLDSESEDESIASCKDIEDQGGDDLEIIAAFEASLGAIPAHMPSPDSTTLFHRTPNAKASFRRYPGGFDPSDMDVLTERMSTQLILREGAVSRLSVDEDPSDMKLQTFSKKLTWE